MPQNYQKRARDNFWPIRIGISYALIIIHNKKGRELVEKKLSPCLLKGLT